MSIALFDTQGRAVARYHLEHAWPSKLDIGGLRSAGTDVAIESLTLVHGALTRA